MAFANVTASDMDDFLDKLYTFATVTDGNWTGIYNVDPGERQIAIERDNCHIALGSNSSEQSISRTPSGTDAILSAALSSSINAGNELFFGHPDSIVTTGTDADRVRMNDLGESINNVWFFSDATYIHAVVQVSGERYTHLSFGIVDPVGQTHSNVAYAVGLYHEWWPDGVESNNIGDTDHKVGHFFENRDVNIYIPDTGVLPSGYPTIGANGTVFNASQMLITITRFMDADDHYANGTNLDEAILDFFLAVDNQPTTGGTPMYGLPALFQEEVSGTSHVWLGLLPDIRLANISSHSPGETLNFGTEEWLIFPLKRKASRDEAQGGSEVSPTANSINWAFAYKKVT